MVIPPLNMVSSTGEGGARNSEQRADLRRHASDPHGAAPTVGILRWFGAFTGQDQELALQLDQLHE
jgi:hypothetical protein